MKILFKRNQLRHKKYVRQFAFKHDTAVVNEAKTTPFEHFGSCICKGKLNKINLLLDTHLEVLWFVVPTD